MNQQVSLYKQAWQNLTAEEGWWKPVLILGLVSCIPIVGTIFAMGYVVEWARDGAWGMTKSLPRKVGDLGHYGKFGLIYFVIYLVWGIVCGIAGGILGLIPLIGTLASVVIALASTILIALLTVRAVLYEEFGAGFQVSRVWAMAKADYKGLLKNWAWYFLVSLIVGVVLGVLITICLVPFIGTLLTTMSGDFSSYSYASTSSTLDLYSSLANVILASGLTLILPLVVICIAATIVNFCVEALFYRAMGMWMKQFNVAEWGDSNQPAPFETRYKQQQYQQSAPQQPQQPYNYDPMTGQPLNAQPQQAQPQQPTDLVIIGYDPNTGQPIYGKPGETFQPQVQPQPAPAQPEPEPTPEPEAAEPQAEEKPEDEAQQ